MSLLSAARPQLCQFQLSTISSQALAILKNEEIIAINQDPVVGKAVSPFRWGTNVRSIHYGPHSSKVTSFN